MRIIYKHMMMLTALLLWLAPTWVQAAGGLQQIETAYGRQPLNTRELVLWTHARLVFAKDIERIAVGQESVLEVDVLDGKEVLLLARRIGRTSFIVWYTDNTSETFLFSVSEDLSLLRGALRDIHPNISIQTAPDRPALVLRGRVPTVDYRVAAETAALGYLGAGQAGDIPLLVQDAGSAAGRVRIGAPGVDNPPGAAIINLIQVEQLPKSLVEKVEEAIATMGGENVRVRRMIRGDVEDDRHDTLILEGKVRDQVSLTRILNLASRLYLGLDATIDPVDAITVVADESGALLQQRNGVAAGGTAFGGVSNGSLNNDIQANIARSKLLSVSGGRILSMIEVQDIPQIRVSVQMHEVNRSRMKSWDPQLSLVTNGYNTDGLFGLGGLSRRGADSASIENALQILNGTLVNNFQVGGSDLAFDLLFSLMEKEGISRTLSRPTLTVLAGESSVFQVGGEVPVPTAFAPTGLSSGDQVGSNTPGVFSGTEFKAFGVQLRVRAMVDENDRITLDVNPTISTPDTLLTEQIAGSTGNNLNSTAFNVRSLSTTTRLRDGQPLVLGGLVSRDISSQENFTPGVHNLPLIGWFAESFDRSDVDKELMIIVTPSLVREPMHQVGLWEFTPALELLDRAVGFRGDHSTSMQNTITENGSRQ